MNTLVGLGVASVGITPVSYVMVSPLQVLVLGIPTMLFYSKVRKSGMLLILSDESTASIEHENETMIQKAIGRLIENRTVLIIAHKLRGLFIGCR
ncbi:MptD family putative ECF transporter S component [Propionibacterium acidifaciens]|uniref:MptD family putative ECF transporter S component n=1 Tax=Propionibacterium acidifaciens TaxID=556499 RepID=UPI00048C33B5|nr:MptD family putative ECF transporter S component [Propionibacterium acidifaciens]